MNILHYVESTDSRMGGVPRFVLDDSRVMAQQGHPSTILTLDTTDTPNEWLSDSSKTNNRYLPRVVKVARPSLGGKLFGPIQLRAIRAEIAQADVVHLHCVWSPTTFQIAVVARQLGVPYVVSLHGMLDDWSMDQAAFKKRAYMALGGTRLLEQAARVHSTATAELDQSNKWFSRGRAEIIPYLMDLEPYRHLPGPDAAREKFTFLKNGEPTFLFLSRLHYKKGCEHLLRAAKLHIDSGKPGQFVFAGTGDESYITSLKNLANELKIDEKVHFVGQVTGQLKLSLYEACDCFVLPTSQENFGLVLVEAMMCRTPVITTKGVDIWKDLLKSNGASVVDQDAAAIADAMAAMTADATKLSEMGEAARNWVFDTFAEDSLIGRYEQFYRTCAATGGGKPVPAQPALTAALSAA